MATGQPPSHAPPARPPLHCIVLIDSCSMSSPSHCCMSKRQTSWSSPGNSTPALCGPASLAISAWAATGRKGTMTMILFGICDQSTCTCGGPLDPPTVPHYKLVQSLAQMDLTPIQTCPTIHSTDRPCTIPQPTSYHPFKVL